MAFRRRKKSGREDPCGAQGKLTPAREAEHATLAAIADGVAAGSIDKAKIDADIAQITAAAGGIHAATQNALNELHAALSPAERAALVEKVESHFEVWNSVSHQQAGP